MDLVSLVVLLICAMPIAGFAIYPAVLWVATRRRPSPSEGDGPDPTSVSLLVAVRNGEGVIGDKIRNALELDYPPELFEIVVASDGSTDRTEEIIRSQEGPQVICRAYPEHVGKAAALNGGFRDCRGDVIVFSDADALLDRDALHAIVRHFRDPRVGGVCGQRVISRDGRELKEAQRRYIRFDSAIKVLESRLGRITSNDGKLYAIRRELFQPIPEAVTDDLFSCLSVIRQGYRFVFEPGARARIRLPSRSAAHEVERRRRIVSRSLRGIGMMRSLLDPRRFGAYSIGLMVNKVLRRLLPVSMILVFAATAALSLSHPAAVVFLALQTAFYAAALSYPVLSKVVSRGLLHRAASMPYYFCVGNYGTLLGLADFVRGRKVARWDPRKADS